MRESSRNEKLFEEAPGKRNLPTPLGIEGQIAELRSHGLEIEDEDSAAEMLRNVSYRRLMGYLPGLEGEDGLLRADATLGMLKELYDFDAELRGLVFRVTEKIETGFRSRLTDFFSLEYGPYGYLEPENLDTARRGRKGDDGPEAPHASPDGRHGNGYAAMLVDEMRRHIEKTPGFLFSCGDGAGGPGAAPSFCEAAEFLPFGLVSKFYKNMKTADRVRFRDEYYAGLKCARLDSWIGAVGYVGNVCAHNGKLYDVRLMVKPAISRVEVRGRSETIGNDRVFGLFLCMKRFLGDGDAEEFLDSLRGLLGVYPAVNVKVMGFPRDWEEMLTDGVVY